MEIFEYITDFQPMTWKLWQFNADSGEERK